jgi:hypothetical protein
VCDIRSDEYKFLRQEHEANRKLVFERPILIVAATLAAAFGTAERGSLGLTVPFLSVLVFNLWFTFNRLESSARIVAYIQLIHEGDAKLPWIGWENAVRRYRRWLFDVERGAAKSPTTDGEVRQFDSMAFYGPIFSFHVILGIIVTGVLVARSDALHRFGLGTSDPGDIWKLFGVVGAVLMFVVFAARFRPGKVRHLTEWKRRAWMEVFNAGGPDAGSTGDLGLSE